MIVDAFASCVSAQPWRMAVAAPQCALQYSAHRLPSPRVRLCVLFVLAAAGVICVPVPAAAAARVCTRAHARLIESGTSKQSRLELFPRVSGALMRGAACSAGFYSAGLCVVSMPADAPTTLRARASGSPERFCFCGVLQALFWAPQVPFVCPCHWLVPWQSCRRGTHAQVAPQCCAPRPE